MDVIIMDVDGQHERGEITAQQQVLGLGLASFKRREAAK
jgi:hypothetical protein